MNKAAGGAIHETEKLDRHKVAAIYSGWFSKTKPIKIVCKRKNEYKRIKDDV